MQLTDNTDCNGNVGCEIAQTEVEGNDPFSPQGKVNTGNALIDRYKTQAEASAGPPASAAVAGSAAGLK